MTGELEAHLSGLKPRLIWMSFTALRRTLPIRSPRGSSSGAGGTADSSLRRRRRSGSAANDKAHEGFCAIACAQAWDDCGMLLALRKWSYPSSPLLREMHYV